MGPLCLLLLNPFHLGEIGGCLEDIPGDLEIPPCQLICLLTAVTLPAEGARAEVIRLVHQLEGSRYAIPLSTAWCIHRQLFDWQARINNFTHPWVILQYLLL